MKVVHVLASGEVKRDIQGHKVKPEDVPEFYKILKKEIRKFNEKKN